MNRTLGEKPSDKPSIQPQNKKPFFSKGKSPAAGANQNKPQQNKDGRKGGFRLFKKPTPSASNTSTGNSVTHNKPGHQGNSQPNPRHKKPTAHRSEPRRYDKKPRKPQNTPTNKPKTHQFLPKTVKVIPLGGLDEVGKNMMAFEYENDIIIVDMGFEFPSDDLYGIDYVIPDTTYLEENAHRIRGVFITHGHLDHIGGIPYILPKLNFPPVFGTKLTMGLVQKRIEEFKLQKFARLNTIKSDDVIKMGAFQISFFHVTHSIPDAVAVVVGTPAGKMVVTGDYKFDETPASPSQKAEVHKMEKLGKEGVLALFGDSTNSLKPGHSMSEEQVYKAFDEVIGTVKGRLIIATFSSQIGRLQQIFDLAAKHNRKVFISGRSMRENIDISMNLGYLKAPRGLISDIKSYKNNTPDSETMIITTGSQGEAVSALSRIASNDHQHIQIKKNDTIVLSSSPIVGNERAIYTMINNLSMRDARVIHNQLKEVHSSGHGYQEEIQRMISLLKPKYLIPVHGEYYMRKGHAELAVEKCGMSPDKVIMIQNGDTLLADNNGIRVGKEKVETKYILIDGSGEGQMGSQVQVDRETMSQNGAVILLMKVDRRKKKLMGNVDVIARGFIYMHETDEITAEIATKSAEAFRFITTKDKNADNRDIKRYVRQIIDKYTHKSLSRSPLIIPLIVEV